MVVIFKCDDMEMCPSACIKGWELNLEAIAYTHMYYICIFELLWAGLGCSTYLLADIESSWLF